MFAKMFILIIFQSLLLEPVRHQDIKQARELNLLAALSNVGWKSLTMRIRIYILRCLTYN